MRRPLCYCAILLVMIMVAAARWLDHSALIFPEIAALAFGAWAAGTRPWVSSTLNLWLSPSLAACTGICIARHVPLSFTGCVVLAFLCVLAQLWILRSAVLPSISAAILPLVTGDTSWSYVVSVSVFMGVVALGCVLLDARGLGNYPRVAPRPIPIPPLRQAAISLWRWGRVLALTALVAWLSQYLQWKFLLAPPLIVACIAYVSPGGVFRAHPFRLYALLLLSALAGSLCTLLAGRGWLPFWLAPGLAMAVVFFLFRRMDLPCPPAAALAVLPTIVPAPLLPWYPLHIAVGAAIFFLCGSLLFPREREQRPARP